MDKRKLGIGMAAVLCATAFGGCSHLYSYSVSHTGGNSQGSTYSSKQSLYDNDVQEKVDTINGIIEDKFYFPASSDEEREEYIYKGLMESLDDPYSVYYTAEEYQELMESGTGVYQGIGVSISQNINTMVLTVNRVFAGSGAEDAGILPKDVITAVNGRELDGEEISEVVTWIKGEPGTTVDITVYRPSEDTEYTYTVERRTIENSSVAYSMREGNIGYIEVTEFQEATAEQFKLAIEDLNRQGMTGLIVDLRNNPGGYVDVVCQMCDYIIEEDVIFYTMKKDNVKGKEYPCKDGGKIDIPMVVLVNGDSASASEIFAGCMQDYKRATIVGTQTFGKGIVQQVIPLDDGSAVKLTIERYFTAKGQDIHGVGITPDVVVELPDELKYEPILTEEQDIQLQKAYELLK